MNKPINTLALCLLIGLLPLSVAADPADNLPLAIRMAEIKIKRFVTTPQQMRDRAWEMSKNTWDSVELIDQRELADGRIEYTLRYSVDQRTRVYTTEQKNTIHGPKNIIVSSFGPLNGPNEELSAHNAGTLIAKCKEWYINDPDYRKIIDILEREVVTKLKYDWDDFYGVQKHSYEQALRLGVGVCDVYARRVKEELTKAGYSAEKWSSSIGSHSWNHVVMPNGRTLYIDATWYDNAYENHPTQQSPDSYDPRYITYDKALFEHGLFGTINMHGAWPDARRVE